MKLRGHDCCLSALLLQALVLILELTPTYAVHTALRAGKNRVDAEIGNILYLVYSDSKFYNTRLKWVEETWALEVPSPSAFVAIGDAPDEDPQARVVPTSCNAHSHWEGACCKYAQAVIQAHQLMAKDSSFDWAYFVDDDAYVRPQALERAIASANPQEAVVLGRFGCNTHKGAGGNAPADGGVSNCTSVCAGGGYLASRKAVESLVSVGEDAFLQEQMANCQRCGKWADAALTQVFIKRKLSMRSLDGLYGFKLQKDKFDRSLQSAVEPIMYHYINSERQMKILHGLFSTTTSDQATQDNQSSGICANFKDRTQCSAKADPIDAPWVDVSAEPFLWEKFLDSDATDMGSVE